MDNQQSRKTEAFNLSLQGTSIQPGSSPLRPLSARTNSQSKQPLTPSRGGSAKERKPSMSTSINLSSARERRLSNSSQRSLVTKSPPPSPVDKKSIPSSTSSSVFRVLSPRHQHHDADGFFTYQSQQKSFQEKSVDDNEWDETRRWADELHQLNSPFTPEQQTQGVGPLGMSRDSLNGTVTGTNLFQTIAQQQEQPLPALESVDIEQLTLTEIELDAAKSPIIIQQSYRQTHIEFEQEKPFENEQIRIPSARETSQQENNIHYRLNNSRPTSASSTARQRRTPIPSPGPPSLHFDDKIRSVSSVTTSSSTSTVTSKVTLDDVYEQLKKLEEIEQFPIQTPLKDDTVYLIDPSASIPPPFIDELPLQTSNLDETNPYDQIVASVRSQKSTGRRPPSPRTNRLPTPPQSSRRQQQPVKLIQSVSIPHHRTSSLIDQQTKITTPYKSLMNPVYPRTPREHELRNSTRTIHTSRDKPFQSRFDNEENQRQPFIVQYHPNQQHELNDYYRKETERDFEHHLQAQKDEYETIIQRHLKFIDQLIGDKKRLSERCEHLISELKIIDRKCNDRIRAVEESQRNDLQKLKDVHDAAEKLRREHWIEEKTKKIKELTVRGLEPEIQKLISRHKNELAKVKVVHEAELLAADERASQRYIRMVEELRDQLEREKDVAIAHERELARDKYEKVLHDEEKLLNEQKRRLYTEIEEEKNRQADLATKQRADLDKLRRDIEANHRNVVETTKHEYEKTRLEQERRYTNEIQELKEKLTLDRQNWEENYMKKQETLLANRERELREQMKHERDREIEKIISQFESDTTSTKEETERTAENRVKRIRDKYEQEFRELENSEKQTKERFNQIKAQMTEVQGDNERLQVLLKQKELEINDIKKITESLQQERERLSDIIRQEFADRLVLTEDENRRIKGEIAELRARQQLELEKKKDELETLQRRQEKELETIHEKIKEAITKKDEQVHTLRVQYETAVKRTEHLEGLLTQQRKLISTVPSSGSNASKKN
ncbi:unnamed protein product [Adineta steineri]|uniref:Uncharacterized protein n=2 Tax=Adineta steineri TaxID=433720 RepID=A0A815MQ64_9BILA|nr:unnamed protein product [Adineta steineri]